MSAISLFEEKQVRRAWNSIEENWYFSIDDVVLALTDSANVKDYIKKLRKRDPALDSYWGTNCPSVEMIAAGGKKRKIKAAHTESLFRIIQSIPSRKAGGTIPGNARRELESESGTQVSTQTNFKQLPAAKAKSPLKRS